MSHTAPDWSWMGKAATVFPVQDMAELSRRLWSPNTFDGRGNTIWMDTFDRGLTGWQTDSYGTGASIVLSTERPLHGAYHVLLRTGTGAIPGAKIHRRLAYPALSKIGLEWAVTCPSGIDNILWQIVIYDGTQRREYKVKYEQGEEKLYYFDENGAYVEFASNVELATSWSCYSVVKLVIDAEAGEYIRQIVNNREISMADLSPHSVADTETANMSIEVQVMGDGTTSKDIYADVCIVTQNEP